MKDSIFWIYAVLRLVILGAMLFGVVYLAKRQNIAAKKLMIIFVGVLALGVLFLSCFIWAPFLDKSFNSFTAGLTVNIARFLFVLMAAGISVGLLWSNILMKLKAFFWSALVMSVYGVILYFVLSRLALSGNYGLTAACIAPFISGVVGALSYQIQLSNLEILNPKRTYPLINCCLVLPTVFTALYLLILFGLFLEGVACIVIAAPLLWAFSVIGALITWLILKYINFSPNRFSMLLPVLLLAFLPVVTQSLENRYGLHEKEYQVSTQIIIEASPDKVFHHVLRFSPLDNPLSLTRPADLIFLMGLPAPQVSTLVCDHPGCVRECRFTQDVALTEKVTRYIPGRELGFDIMASVGPQNALTGLDLHMMPGGTYFTNQTGHFKITPLSSYKSLITGTTVYKLNSSMNWYAHPWADFIIHTIHEKVLDHIKDLSES